MTDTLTRTLAIICTEENQAMAILRRAHSLGMDGSDESWNEHYEWEFKILKFIFSRVIKDRVKDIFILKLECTDNTTIVEELCAAGLMSEEERQSVISCVTHSDKNK